MDGWMDATLIVLYSIIILWDNTAFFSSGIIPLYFVCCGADLGKGTAAD